MHSSTELVTCWKLQWHRRDQSHLHTVESYNKWRAQLRLDGINHAAKGGSLATEQTKRPTINVWKLDGGGYERPRHSLIFALCITRHIVHLHLHDRWACGPHDISMHKDKNITPCMVHSNFDREKPLRAHESRAAHTSFCSKHCYVQDAMTAPYLMQLRHWIGKLHCINT